MVSRSVASSLAVATLLSLVACSSDGSATPAPSAAGPSATQSATTTGANDSTTYARPASGTYRIATLGDSYTVGTGTDAPGRDSWPAQLRAALTQRSGLRINLRNLAREGSTSDEVLEEQLREVADFEPDVVTLQVGLNDIVPDDEEWSEWYGGNVGDIFEELLLVLGRERIFAITTPDHTLTEWGRAYGDRRAVEALNAILREEAGRRGIEVIDIGPINERVSIDDSLLVQASPPVPYPTAKQYAGWAETIGPYVRNALAGVEP